MNNWTIADLVMLLAAAQGVFLGAIILHKYGKLLANRFLVTLLFLHAGLLIHMSLQNVAGDELQPRLVLVVIGSAFLIGPLHFLYARFLTHPGDIPRRREVLHAVPFLAFEALVLFLYHPNPLAGAGTPETQAAWLHDYGFFHFAVLLHYTAYLIQTLRTLREYGQRVRTVFSTLEQIKLTWLRDITWLAVGIVVIYGTEYGLLLLRIGTGNYFAVSSILLALNIYAMGYLGFFKSEVLSGTPLREGMKQTASYSKSGLTAGDLAHYQAKLLTIMTEQSPHTESSLTLDQLAGLAGLSPHNLSEVINRGLGQNFFDFVNSYRVRAVQRDLLDPQKSHLTVLALALAGGFASKSTFNSIFKKHTGLTPTSWRKANSSS